MDMFETQVWKVEVCRDTVLTIIGVYRPPYSIRNGNTVTKFLDGFTAWIVDMITNHSNIILMGKFNIHGSDEDDTKMMTFLDTIQALGLEQWVEKPTQRSDNILDLVVLEAEGKTKLVRCTTGGFISDHQAVHSTLELKQSTVRRKEVTYHHLKKIDTDMFTLDLADKHLKGDDLDCIISEFETRLKQTLKKNMSQKSPRKSQKGKGSPSLMTT